MTHEERKTYKREWYRRRYGVTNGRSIDRTPDARFDFYTCYVGDCIVWTGNINKTTGYGYFNINRVGVKIMLAHRYAYERQYGAILDGLEIDHLCKNRCCVNAGHLEAVTRSVNVRRSTNGLWHRRRSDSITHCKHGHPFDEVNTYRMPNGSRACRVCRSRRTREYKQRQAK